MDTHRIIEKENYEVLEGGPLQSTIYTSKEVVWSGDHVPTETERVDSILYSNATWAERTVQTRRILIHVSRSAMDIKWGFGWKDLYDFDQTETLFNFRHAQELATNASL